MARADDNSGSAILVDEYFDRQDPRFVAEVRKLRAPGKLAALAERWKRDSRPWARQQVLAYLEEPLNRPGHQVLVKRLFKHAEARGDHELMAAFMVAFDRLVRRFRQDRWEWDRSARQSLQTEVLALPRNSMPGALRRTAQNPKTLQRIEVPVRTSDDMRLFRYPTRYYLRRRAWRYFRRLGLAKPADYVPAVAAALLRYGDSDLASGENILDNWALVHALYARSDVLAFDASRIKLRAGRTLAELKPAPELAKLWKEPSAAAALLGLVRTARSRLVRVWAMDLLRQDHTAALGAADITLVLELLDTADEEVQQFGTELLTRATGLEKLALTTWLELLETHSPAAIAVICDLFRKHVDPGRLSLDQCLHLACEPSAPVARLGLDILKGRTLVGGDRKSLVRLAGAQCAALGGEAAALALGCLGTKADYDVDLVIEFFDSLVPTVRAGGWMWLTDGSPGWSDPALWCRLLESPFEDVRSRLVEALDQRAGRLPGAKAGGLEALWCSALLAVHRGGRRKLDVVRQVASALTSDPAADGKLLHVLSLAVRSIRGPERRAGLAAVMRVLAGRPELAGAVAQAVPELKVIPQEVRA